MHTELSSSENDRWQSFLEQLREYVRLELNGRAADEILPHIAFYIETVPQCEAAYDEEFRRQGLHMRVEELRQLGRSWPLEQILAAEPAHADAATLRAPDPGWIERSFSGGRAWLDRTTRRWRQLELILPSLGFGNERAPVLAGLMSAPRGQPADDEPVGLDLPDDATLEIRLSWRPDTAGRDSRISAETTAGEPVGEHGTLEIAVTPKEHFGDFAGIEVTLAWGESIQMRTTDSMGKASFNKLPANQLGQMSLVVRMPDVG